MLTFYLAWLKYAYCYFLPWLERLAHLPPQCPQGTIRSPWTYFLPVVKRTDPSETTPAYNQTQFGPLVPTHPLTNLSPNLGDDFKCSKYLLLQRLTVTSKLLKAIDADNSIVLRRVLRSIDTSFHSFTKRDFIHAQNEMLVGQKNIYSPVTDKRCLIKMTTN